MFGSKWLDTHVHVSNVGPDGQPREDILPDLLEVLDASSADLRFVLSGDFPWPGRMMKDPTMVLAGNEFIRDVVDRAPDRLYGACMINPHFPDESAEAMETCFEQWGFVMLGEMLQYIMNYRMATDAVEQLVLLAAEYDVPVQVHISTSNSGPQGQFQGGGTEQLEDLMDLAERVPQAKYILAHLVGMPNDNPTIVDGYLEQIEARFGAFPNNFWAEIRDFSSPGLKSVLQRVPVERLIAGTDWVTRVGPPFPPYGTLFGVKELEGNPYEPKVESMRDFLRAAGAGDADIACIAYGNAMELLGIE